MSREASASREASIVERLVSLGPGLPRIPERLLLAHARGEVLFIAGSGASKPSAVPDFRGLTQLVYSKLDAAVHAAIATIPLEACNKWHVDKGSLTDQQAAEVRRFVAADYDVVLGMLERRIDGNPTSASRVRQIIQEELRGSKPKPAPLHVALMRLANRGAAVTIATTNFEHLLEDAARSIRQPIESYTLGGIPRPGMGPEFAGVLHIHGAFDRNPARSADLIVTDRDFGEFYLRRRVVSDFVYDAARLFHIVLVGYSANDPPMRYLLNSVAADGNRFSDLKERFTFVGSDFADPILLEDWKGRGITPISYDSSNQHAALLDVLARWAALSSINGSKRLVDAEIARIVKTDRPEASESDRDLFDHLIRRSETSERIRLSTLASKRNADLGWLDSISNIFEERR